MSDTPRSDEEEDVCRDCRVRFVSVSFAQELERELTAVTRLTAVSRERDEARAESEALQPGIDHLRETCDGLEAERDALRAELAVSEKSSAEYMAERNQARDLVRAKNAEIDALRAEVERLRGALHSLAAVARRYLPDYDEHPEVQKADEALQEPTP